MWCCLSVVCCLSVGDRPLSVSRFRLCLVVPLRSFENVFEVTIFAVDPRSLGLLLPCLRIFRPCSLEFVFDVNFRPLN